MSANLPVIIALDFPDASTTLNFVRQFPHPENLFCKVGMELYYREGPAIVRDLKDLGVQIFLDLKLHDIPNTVGSAARIIGQLGVTLTTVHALGGSKMMAAAKQGILDGAAAAGVAPAKVLAITQLTSTSPAALRDEQQIATPLPESVTHLAQLAAQSGLDGVVSSAAEVAAMKPQLSAGFKFITPGIRLKQNQTDDQVRVMTPDAARRAGSSGIVVGRPITQAADPVAAYEEIKRLWEEPVHE
ncbi:orotidine-5'-phosphate decarboxylase [Lacticaseibacillus pabuli]|uniref:Orotidine 5'-phosphate decarboxylase n=1 Tax=Lacticaseibacillus pabuli TaxID=3025672 RepID=A0ABY7WTI7_9LACO|nr:orotidine-5'-phosphate decarboxylase [Lacticaseibacillus sp. KACC 23028]WDF82312.1 orotidine-5'-phosphate decarboxylase [Lacticaseibacillus sp. KACC 23028]